MTNPRLNRTQGPVLWRSWPDLVAYDEASRGMEKLAGEIHQGAQEQVWLLEHPPLYTAGTSAKKQDLREPKRFPVYESPRGGQYTYHGPGQRVAYVMLDLARRKKDVRRFVQDTEAWLINALQRVGVQSGIREGRVGVWVDRGEGREDKIAAIGVRIRRWVTFHGIALNVSPDLEHFSGIVPCGIAEERLGVTSLADLGVRADMHDVDDALRLAFEEIFGPTEQAVA